MTIILSIIVHILYVIAVLFGHGSVSDRIGWVNVTVNTPMLVETVCGPWDRSQIVVADDGSWFCDAT